MSKYCQNCGQELQEEANVCSKCGVTLNQSVNAQNIAVKNPTNGMAIAGFVLSLVSLICCGCTSLLGLIFSIIGLVQSKKMNGSGKGLAIAGIVISCIFTLLVLMLTLLGFTAGIVDGLQSSSYTY